METKKELAVKTIPIIRMECPTCIPIIEREVERLEGVEEARGNYMTKTLKVTYYPDQVQLQEIEAAIERIGYRIAYKKYPSLVSRIRGLLLPERPIRIEVLSDADFPGKVLHASKTVAVLFSTSTCPICRGFKSVFEEASDRLSGRADFYEMDITSTETWRSYDILTVPTVFIFRGGEVVERFTALPRIEEVEEALRV